MTFGGVAHACDGPASETGIIFTTAPAIETLPPGAIILDVSFDNLSRRQLESQRLQTVSARVRQTLHGYYGWDRIDVQVGMTSCSRPFTFGTEGIIVVIPGTAHPGEAAPFVALERGRDQH